MKLFHNPRSITAMTRMVAGALLLTWLASMLGITWMTSLDYLNFYEEKSDIYSAAMTSMDLERAERSSFPGAVEEVIWSKLAYGSNHAYEVRAYNGDTYLGSDYSFDWQTAVAVYNGNGTLIANSGDFLFFPYDTEEYWENADVNSVMNCSGYSKVDLDMDVLMQTIQSEDSYIVDSWFSWTSFMTFDIKVMRLTGVFDEMEFRADQVEYVLDTEFQDALFSREPDVHYFESDGTEVVEYNQYSYSEVIRTEDIPWHTLYDNGKQTEGAVTIYTTDPQGSFYDEGGPLAFDDAEYDTLLSLLLAQDISDSAVQSRTNNSITDLIILEQSYIYDYDNLIETEDGGKTPGHKYIITTAVRCSPLLSTMSELKGLYLVTFLLAAALSLAVCLALRRNLILPMEQVNDGIESGWSDISRTDNIPTTWREPRELIKLYAVTQDQLRMRKNEITRLNTALEYAKDAEQNRRQMVSNIAHEFKTPLAVIHSYAEGLNEHIAEGKREKYLNVILSESDRLDAMVLELLDLSRLEAGKVRLARDEFDLTEVARGVLERLDMAAQAKGLSVEFDVPDRCTVTADEGRIRQVIENFASNAIKYTPIGGGIRIRITEQIFSTRPTTTTFSIENDSPPLSEETLNQVWDTFYRADDSRSSGGTGLGLAIAKNIVELHGGTCSVHNTETGVEFQFII